MHLPTRTPLLPALLLIALALAGCSNSGAGQEGRAEGTLAYNGASNGSHTETFESDGSCDLHVAANLGSGRVRISLVDGAGGETSQDIEGPGPTSDNSASLSGEPGTWTLRAERTSNSYGAFTGQYVATATC